MQTGDSTILAFDIFWNAVWALWLALTFLGHGAMNQRDGKPPAFVRCITLSTLL